MAKIRKTKLVPPDGGWGWLVLMSALVVNFLIPGTVKSFGVLFVEFLQVFESSPIAASWMPALCYFLYSSLGPLSSVLSMKYSYKTVTMIGGAFAASGMMLSYFATSVTYLYISYGVFVGIGAGLTFPPTVYIVTSYFERLRGFATGLCISGSAIGTIVLPLFLQYLLNHFGHKGAVLIMGAVLLNTIVVAFLYHPVEEHMKEVPIEGVDNEAMTMEEDTIIEETNKSTQLITDFNTPVITKTETTIVSTDHLADLSMALEKTLTMQQVDTIAATTDNNNQDKENNKDCTEEDNQTQDNEKSEKIIEENISTDEINSTVITCEIGNIKNINSVLSTPVLSRNSSIRKSNKSGFHLTRQHSIVSEMGQIGLSPKLNVPNIFRRIFKPQKKEKIRQSKTTKTSDNIKNLKQNEERKISNASLLEKNNDKKNFFDLSVLKDPIYLVILISNSTSAISNTNFMIFLPSYAISQGYDKNMAALLLSIVSAFDLVGRIGGASLSDINFIPKYYYFVCGLGMSGIALSLLPMATTYTMLSFFCALFGLSSGMYIGITTVILADMLGTEKLSSSYGISLFVNGILQLIFPPTFSYIYEKVGTYKPIFLAYGIILILGTTLWALVPIILRKKKKNMADNNA